MRFDIHADRTASNQVRELPMTSLICPDCGQPAIEAWGRGDVTRYYANPDGSEHICSPTSTEEVRPTVPERDNRTTVSGVPVASGADVGSQASAPSTPERSEFCDYATVPYTSADHPRSPASPAPSTEPDAMFAITITKPAPLGSQDLPGGVEVLIPDARKFVERCRVNAPHTPWRGSLENALDFIRRLADALEDSERERVKLCDRLDFAQVDRAALRNEKEALESRLATVLQERIDAAVQLSPDQRAADGVCTRCGIGRTLHTDGVDGACTFA